MFTKKLIFLSLLTITTALISGSQGVVANSTAKQSANCPGKNSKFSIEFFQTNNNGERYPKGINHVIIFNPQSPELDFKVNIQ